jgi:hypothetical protein
VGLNVSRTSALFFESLFLCRSSRSAALGSSNNMMSKGCSDAVLFGIAAAGDNSETALFCRASVAKRILTADDHESVLRAPPSVLCMSSHLRYPVEKGELNAGQPGTEPHGNRMEFLSFPSP